MAAVSDMVPNSVAARLTPGGWAASFCGGLRLVARVFGVGEKEQTAATEVLRRFSNQDLTLTDAVGLHLMKTQRLRACWSTDFHLGLTGVPLVVNAT
jgi:hypothetical protein